MSSQHVDDEGRSLTEFGEYGTLAMPMRKRRGIRQQRQPDGMYELLIGRAVVWKGRDLVTAFDRMARQHPKAKIRIRCPQPHDLLIAIETF